MNQANTRRAGRPTPAEAAHKQHVLITTALDEFAQMGFHGASLRTIAEKAQVSTRTLYNHYTDKLALFEACLKFSGRQIMPLAPHMKGSLHKRLTEYVTAMLALLTTPQARQIATLIFREASCFVELRRIAQNQFFDNQVMPLVAMLEAAGVDPANSGTLARQFAIMATGEWQSRLLFGLPEMTPAEMKDHAELVTGIFLSGIAATHIAQASPAG